MPLGHQKNEKSGVTIWLTGLPCAGKSTIAQLLELRLRTRDCRVEVLDGDVARKHLTKGLGFSREDRDENIRRIGFVCHLLTRNGVIAISAAISPYRSTRDEVRRLIGSFVEVFVDCPLEVCKQRDVKGMYKKALAGEIAGFTGVSDPYEEPLNPELTLHTDRETPEESARNVLEWVKEAGYLAGETGDVKRASV